jgi:hypothetical protein
MSKVSIKAMVDAYAATLAKTWEHDRSSTIGASEVGRCLRACAFSKNHPEQADAGDDDYGARLRGDILERHLWVPAIEHAVRGSNSLEFLFGGDQQRTLALGFLSATVDGLLVGVDLNCLAHLGVPNIVNDELVVECKTHHPMMKLLEPKPEHVFQVQVQMGLLREVTDYWPWYALISYVDAATVSTITEFVVPFDQAAFDAARRRAHMVFAAASPADLPPEGRLEGGRECRWCDYATPCAAIEADAVPEDVADELPPVVVKNLCEMVMVERAWRREKKNAERQLALTQESIRQMMREAHTRAAQGSGWSLSYSRVKGRRSLDVKALVEAARAAGVDVSQFERAGPDADRLVVRTLGEGGGDDDDGE